MTEKGFVDCNSFVLSESIAPSFIEYGTDLKNTQWILLKDDYDIQWVFTFFKKYDLYYRVDVCIDTNEIAFGVSEHFDQDKIKDITWVIQNFSDDRKKTFSAIRVFSHIIYVVLDATKKFDLNQIRFDSANPALGSMYDKLVTNKYLLSALAKYHFQYHGQIDGYYTFQKLSKQQIQLREHLKGWL